MKFEEWVDREKGEVVSRTTFLREFSTKCDVSLQTLQFVVKGGRISLYNKARDISVATGGDVSIPELCE